MLKNKSKIIALLMILILTLTLPIVRADNENTSNSTTQEEATSVEETTQDTSNTTDATNSTDNQNTDSTYSEENFKKNDVYLFGDNVTIDYIVDGNLFVFADEVVINSQIGGDAFICANSVTIEQQGYIFSNLFTCAKNVTINGVVYDLYVASENTTINGYVYRDVKISSNTVNFVGTVGRNAYVTCGNINFLQSTDENNTEQQSTLQGSISGNLNYYSKQEASIPEGFVKGETNFEPLKTTNANSIQTAILTLGSFVATVAIIWLVCLWLAPKFLKNNTSLLTTKKILPTIGLGILTPIVLVILSIILFFIGITSMVGVLLLAILFVLLAISTSICVITINDIICNKLKIEKNIAIFGILIATSIVLWLIGLIPWVGLLVKIIVAILGLGIITTNLIFKEKLIKE